MKIKHLPYPEAERTEVVDNYFGTEGADPYRWPPGSLPKMP